jgi:hypothetical protein
VRQDRRGGAPTASRFSSSPCAFTGRAPTGTVDLWDEYDRWRRASPEELARALSGRLIGSPDTLRQKLRRFETSHIDQVILLN